MLAASPEMRSGPIGGRGEGGGGDRQADRQTDMLLRQETEGEGRLGAGRAGRDAQTGGEQNTHTERARDTGPGRPRCPAVRGVSKAGHALGSGSRHRRQRLAEHHFPRRVGARHGASLDALDAASLFKLVTILSGSWLAVRATLLLGRLSEGTAPHGGGPGWAGGSAASDLPPCARGEIEADAVRRAGCERTDGKVRAPRQEGRSGDSARGRRGLGTGEPEIEIRQEGAGGQEERTAQGRGASRPDGETRSEGSAGSAGSGLPFTPRAGRAPPSPELTTEPGFQTGESGPGTGLRGLSSGSVVEELPVLL